MKTNPNNIPRTEADCRRAARKATDKTIDVMRTLTFNVLLDKFGFDTDDIARFCYELDKLSESVTEKRCSIADLQRVLLEERNIDMKERRRK